MDFWMLARVAPTTVAIGDSIEIKVVKGALCAKVPAGTFILVGPPPIPPEEPYAREGFVGTIVAVRETPISVGDDNHETGSEITARAGS